MVIYKFKYGLYEALISTVTISLTHCIIINLQPTPEYFMFRIVATFQECCLKALNSREKFFKVTNVLVIARSVDWRLPIQFVFCFHRDQFLPIPSVIHPFQPPPSALVT